MTSRRLRAALALGAVAAAGAGAGVYYLTTGQTYRLYSSALAGDCWRALELTTLSTSSITPVSVGAPVQRPNGRARVSIDYRMDRVLGGRTLNVTCVFASGDELVSVEFEGIELDADTLADVNEQLSRD